MRSNLSHLSKVFSRFGLTNCDVAEMLNIHYSLVSKWLNNKRPLKYNSEHLKKLIKILISFDASDNQQRLKTLLLDAYPDADLTSKEKLSVYLHHYLATDRLEQNDNTIFGNIDSGCVYSKAKIDIYRKNVGRRDALMRLLDTAIALSPGCELMLYSGEDLFWHMENSEFTDKWLEKYNKIIQLENHVTMVHTVHRHPSQLLYSIAQWLPLHLTGKTSAYYHSEYSNTINKTSISLIKGYAALTGITVDGFSDTFNTYYFTDQDMVKQCESIFLGLLTDCHPLFENPRNNITQNMLILARKYEKCYNFSTLPLEYAFDVDTCCEILHENGISGNKFECSLDYFKKSREYMLESLRKSEVTLMLHNKILEKGIKEGFPSSSFNWIIFGNLMISSKYYKKGLKSIVELIDKNRNLSLGLIDDYLLPNARSINMIVKENTAISANSSITGTRNPLFIKEPSIVRTFYQYFEHYWDSIPVKQRKNDNVVDILQQLAQ